MPPRAPDTETAAVEGTQCFCFDSENNSCTLHKQPCIAAKDGLVKTSKSQLSNKQQEQFRTDITWQELWEHNGDDPSRPTWIALYGVVYEITPTWMDKHPGGQDMLRLFAGRDATYAFESYHMLDDANKMLAKRTDGEPGEPLFSGGSSMLPPVGLLASHELPLYMPEKKSQFYATLKKRVVDHFRAKAESQKGGRVNDRDLNMRSIEPFTIFNTAFILSGLLIGYYMSMYAPLVGNGGIVGTTVAILFAIMAGVFHHLSMVHLWHDMSHAAYSRNPAMWYYFGNAADFLVGLSCEVWRHRHCVGHHVYTNVPGIDPDIAFYKASPNRPIRKYRSKSVIIPSWFQPFMYFFVVAQIQVDDFISFWRRSMENVKMNHRTLYDRVQFYGGKLLFLTHRILLPIFLGTRSGWATIGLFVITEATAGLLFGIFSQTTHVTEEMEWPDNEPITKDWAELQVLTATDYEHDSAFWTYMAGYLNYQVVHHLLPSIGPHNYPALLPLVKQTCEDFGIQYNILPSFWTAVQKHLSHLKQFQSYRERFLDKVRSGQVKAGLIDSMDIMIRDMLSTKRKQQ